MPKIRLTTPCTVEKSWRDESTQDTFVLLRFSILDSIEAKSEKLKTTLIAEGDGLYGFRQLLVDFPEWGDWRRVHAQPA